MRIGNGYTQLSATDLANHLSCKHLTSLDLLSARGEIDEPDWTNPATAVLQALGIEHEVAYLDHLRGHGLNVAVVERGDGDSAPALMRTLKAMKAGSDVIYQPSLKLGLWVGRADVLLRVDTASDLGPWSYEVVDCKLARSTRAGTILQLALYSECVKEVQGVRPNLMHVLTPGTDFEPMPYRTVDYLAYYRSVSHRLLEAIRNENHRTYPEPTPHCDICRWWRSCETRRRADDHPCFVAGISRLQMQQLCEWDIETLQASPR